MLKFIVSFFTAFGVMISVANANEKPELIIYTYDSFASEWGPGPQIKTEFEKTCDCVVTFVGLDSSVGILGRIQLEGAASKADIALGLDTSLTSVAASTGLFAPHRIETAGKLALPDDVSAWTDPQFVHMTGDISLLIMTNHALPKLHHHLNSLFLKRMI